MCTQTVQLNIGLRKKSLMGVLAQHTNICQLQEEQRTQRTASAVYCTAINMYSLRNIWADQNACTCTEVDIGLHTDGIRAVILCAVRNLCLFYTGPDTAPDAVPGSVPNTTPNTWLSQD